MNRIILLLCFGLAMLSPARAAVNVQFDFYNSALAPQGGRDFFLYPECIRAVNPLGLTTRDRLYRAIGTNGSVTVSNLVWGDYRGEFRGTYTTTTNWFSIAETDTGLVNATNLVRPAFICAGSSVPAYSTWSLKAGSNMTFHTAGAVTYIDGGAGGMVSFQGRTNAAAVLTAVDVAAVGGVTNGGSATLSNVTANLYRYGNGSNLAGVATLYYPNGEPLADIDGRWYFGDGNVFADALGNLEYHSGGLFVDQDGNHYYHDGNVMADAVGNLSAKSLSIFTTNGTPGQIYTGTNPATAKAVMKEDTGFSGVFSSPGVGTNSEKFGAGATFLNDATNATVFGANASVGVGGAVFGSGAVAAGYEGTAIGRDAIASDKYTFAGGAYAHASSNDSIALGYSSTASGFSSLAIGTGAKATGEESVGLGRLTFATAKYSIALGRGTASGYGSLALGGYTYAGESNSIALGLSATASHPNSTAIGHNSATTDTNQVMLGTASGTVNVPGTLVASLSASALASGTVPDARLSGNVALLNGTNAFTGTNTFSNPVSTPQLNLTGTGTNLVVSTNLAVLGNVSATGSSNYFHKVYGQDEQLQVDGLGATFVPSFVSSNGQPAVLNGQQYSPFIAQYGQGFRSGNSTSMPIGAGWVLVPQQGTSANPAWQLQLVGSVSNSAFATGTLYPMYGDNNGNFGCANVYASGGSGIRVAGGAPYYWQAKSQLFSPTNGTLQLLLSDLSGALGLFLGKTTEDWPYIKVENPTNSPTVSFRNGNDSANISIRASAVIMTNQPSAPTPAQIGAGNGATWVSNTFLYYSYTADGSASNTAVKLAP